MWLIKKKNKKRLAFSVKRIAQKADLSANRCSLCAKKGFTLIELMMAASILSLIGLAILTTFGAGLRVYERVQSYGGVQAAEALLSLEEIEQNLRNTFPHSAIKFSGDTQSIAFPALIETIEMVGDEEQAVSSVGQVSYYLSETDEEESILAIERWDYSKATEGAQAGEGRSNTLAFIENIEFSYYFFDEKSGVYGWKDSWDKEEENFPVGVSIKMTFQDDGRDVQLARTVFIPAIQVDMRGEEGGDEEEGEGGEGV